MTHPFSGGPPEQPPLIRVATSNLTGVLSQLLHRLIDSQPDMALVGEVPEQGPGSLASLGKVDLLIVGSPRVHPPPGLVERALDELPRLKVLVLNGSGDQAAIYWLGLHQQRVQSVDSQALLSNLRQVLVLGRETESS